MRIMAKKELWKKWEIISRENVSRSLHECVRWIIVDCLSGCSLALSHSASLLLRLSLFLLAFRRPSTHKNMCINLFLSPISLKKIYYYYIFSLFSFLIFLFFVTCAMLYIFLIMPIYIIFFSSALSSHIAPFLRLIFYLYFLKNNK